MVTERLLLPGWEYTTVPGFLGVGPGPGLVRVGSGNGDEGVGRGSPGGNLILSTNITECLGEREAKCWEVDPGSCFCQTLQFLSSSFILMPTRGHWLPQTLTAAGPEVSQ